MECVYQYYYSTPNWFCALEAHWHHRYHHHHRENNFNFSHDHRPWIQRWIRENIPISLSTSADYIFHSNFFAFGSSPILPGQNEINTYYRYGVAKFCWFLVRATHFAWGCGVRTQKLNPSVYAHRITHSAIHNFQTHFATILCGGVACFTHDTKRRRERERESERESADSHGTQSMIYNEFIFKTMSNRIHINVAPVRCRCSIWLNQLSVCRRLLCFVCTRFATHLTASLPARVWCARYARSAFLISIYSPIHNVYICLSIYLLCLFVVFVWTAWDIEIK